MSELTPEEKQAIEQRHPWGTLWMLLLLFAAFIAGWLYFWELFISLGPLH